MQLAILRYFATVVILADKGVCSFRIKWL